MAKMEHFITVLMTAFSVLQVNTLPVTPVTRQATTEMPRPSTTDFTSTSSSTMSPSTVSSTTALMEAHTTNCTSVATSIHQTATSSQPHTASHGEVTTTDQTSTSSAVTNSSKTTDFWSGEPVSLTTILSSTEEPKSTAASTEVNAVPRSEITTSDQSHTSSAVTNSSETTYIRSEELISLSAILLFTEDQHKSTAASSGENPNSASSNKTKDNMAMNPGLVAILCIFFIVLALVLVVAIAKIISCRGNSNFERLDDLPMSQQSKVNENAPFARYPPK